MGFYFVSRPEPLSPAKRLETRLLMRRTRCDSAEIGPKTGPRNRRRAVGATTPDASKPASQLGSSSGASGTRTGGLLGAIQALASPEFGLFAGFSLRWRPGLRLAFSASSGPFGPGSGQRTGVLARSLGLGGRRHESEPSGWGSLSVIARS